MGQSPGHGNAPSFVYAVSPNGQGDVTKSGLLWSSSEVGRVVGTPIVKDGLLYVGDLSGPFIVSTRQPARIYGSTRLTMRSGDVSCWRATGFTLETLKAS
jgi:hypothetical protein